MSNKIMLSGIQPTGSLHIGNYLGALKNWADILNDYYGFFCIVDYHAITVEYDVSQMQKRIMDAAVEYLACGLDPNKCSIFVQSDVRAHTELAWIFNSIIPVAELERMTQYKDKSRKNVENINAALLTYPSLMAADILLYHPDIVPVGEDQEQHVELTRMIVRKFNNRYGEYFKEPDTYHGKVLRILGLDGQNKMSKSLNNCIYLKDSADDVAAKVKTMFTDPNHLRVEDPGNTTENPVFLYISVFAKPEHFAAFLPEYSGYDELAAHYERGGLGDVKVKKFLNSVLQETLRPIREKREEFARDIDKVVDILREGTKVARVAAEETVKRVKHAMKLNYFD